MKTAKSLYIEKQVHGVYPHIRQTLFSWHTRMCVCALVGWSEPFCIYKFIFFMYVLSAQNTGQYNHQKITEIITKPN